MGSVVQPSEVRIRELWTEAQSRFEEKAKDLLDSKVSLRDAVKVVNQNFNPTAKDSGGTQAKIKEYAINILNCVQLLGGVVAQGASVVFGPASLCFSALQILLTIPAKISSFHDHLALLLQEVNAFMSQFEIYQRIDDIADIGTEFKESVHKLLIAFVDVCAMCIKFGRHHKFSNLITMGKLVLFDNDSGVNGALANFKLLMEHHKGISGAVTLERVVQAQNEMSGSMKTLFVNLNEAAEQEWRKLNDIEDKVDRVDVKVDGIGTDLKSLNKNASDAKEKSQRDERLKQVKTKLGVKEISQDHMKSQAVTDTGDWLAEQDAYREWIDLDSRKQTLLFLSGKPSSGKTTLLSTVLHNLRRNNHPAENVKAVLAPTSTTLQADGQKRISVSTYTFSKNERSTTASTKSKFGLYIQAVKVAALQFATDDPVYLKNLWSYLEQKDPDDATLLQDLFAINIFTDASNMVFFLLLDGLDQLPMDDAKSLLEFLSIPKAARMRFLVSGTEQFYESCVRSLPEASDLITEIAIEQHNRPDIVRVIDDMLSGDKAFQGEEGRIAATELREKLPDIANGNYRDAEIIIDKVREDLESYQEMDIVLGRINQSTIDNKSVVVEKIIGELVKSLSRQEIEHLNELLIWTIYALESFSVDQMRAVLFLFMGRELRQDFETKIEKYSGLLKIDPRWKTLSTRDPETEQYFRDSKRSQGKDAEAHVEEPRITMTISFNNAKISQVQRFLWKLSEPMLLGEKFPNSNLVPEDTPANEMLAASPIDGALTISRRCFDLLFKPRIEQTKLLEEYATKNVLMQVSRLSDRLWDPDQSLKPSEKQEITKELVELLRNPEYIENHLTADFFQSLHLLDTTSTLPALESYLLDEEATKGLRAKERSWVSEATKDNIWHALDPIAKMVATQWLCSRTWKVFQTTDWLDAYLDKIEYLQETDDTMKDPDSSKVLGKTQRMVRWAEQEAKLTSKDALWFERIGTAHSNDKDYHSAIEAYLKARALGEISVLGHMLLAASYADSKEKDFETASREMDQLLNQLLSRDDLTEEDTELLTESLSYSAEWSVKLGRPEDGVARLRESIKRDSKCYSSYVALLEILVNIGQRDKALELLTDLNQQNADDTELTQLGSLLLHFATQHPLDCLDCISKFSHATREDSLSVAVSETIEKTLHHIKGNDRGDDDWAPLGLQLSLGVALFRRTDGEADHVAEALETWKQCIKTAFAQHDLGVYMAWEIAKIAAGFLFPYYIPKVSMLRNDEAGCQQLLEELNDLLRDAPSYNVYGAPARQLLASAYTCAGQRDKARDLLKDDMWLAMALLSDDDPGNDDYGYSQISSLLLSAGEYLDAMSAWSLIGPPSRHVRDIASDDDTQQNETTETQKENTTVETETGPWWHSCWGNCDNVFTWSSRVWCCKFCDNRQFCDDCLDKLRKGVLPRMVCGPNHEWIRAPTWTSELEATGKKNVRVGGSLPEPDGPCQDGVRIGGETVSAETWLDNVREKWGIEKPGSGSVVNDDEKSSRSVTPV